jgi:hypothetical protein
MSKTNLYIKATAPSTGGGWTRPTEWLPLPDFAPSDNRSVVLMAIYENDLNYTVIAGGGGGSASTAYWGDGTSTVTNGGYQVKEYDYVSLSGSVSVDEFGRNYKQVIIDIIIPNVVTATVIRLERNGTGIYQNKPSTYLDLKAQSTTLNGFDLFYNRYAPLLKRIDLSGLTVHPVYSLTNLTKARRLEEIYLNYNITTGYNSLYAYQQLIKEIGDINSNATLFTGFFSYSNIKKIGNINLPNCTSIQAFAINCDVIEVGDVYAPLATAVMQAFRDCVNLTKVGTITFSSGTTLVNEMFYNCNIEEIVITNSMANVTNVTNFVGASYNFKRLVTPNLTRGVSLPYAKMTADALNEFFTSLGTAAGSQTITIRGNPGDATCDISIATSKGYTVIV